MSTSQYMKRSKKMSFGRDIGKPLPDKTFYFAIANNGKKYELTIDGVQVEPKDLGDFVITGWRYSSEYQNKLNSRSKLSRIIGILKESNEGF